jgi:alpha-L-rhamnosidase
MESIVTVHRATHQFAPSLVAVPLQPIFISWQVASEQNELSQLGYEVQVGKDQFFENAWSTGKQTSSQQLEVAVAGLEPKPRAVYFTRVRIETELGMSQWSEPLRVEFAVSADDIIAQPIRTESVHSSPADLFRKEFYLPEAPVSARLYFSAQGVTQPLVNGVVQGNEFLMPGWTAYQERLNLITFDVTNSLSKGENVIGFELSDGWFRGKMGFMNKYDNYGIHTTVVAQLEVQLADGSTKTIVTDQSWKSSQSEVQFADIYDGCRVDFNKGQPGWSSNGFDDDGWGRAIETDLGGTTLTPRVAAGISQVDRLPMTISKQSDRYLLNAGQNIAGWVRLRVIGKTGDVVTIRHAEILEPGDKLHVKALRSAKATATYVLSKDGISLLEPKFTFHGFQYADVVGDVEIVDATAVAISSAGVPRSSFDSANQRLNKLHSNVVWSQLDNFVGLPTDCPQRDERLGWTGDAQAFSYTASTLFDTESFWRSWLIDLEIDQDPVEGVPAVVPDIIKLQPDIDGWKTIGRAGWADAATIVPDAVYQSFGSKQILQQQMNSMRGWVDSLANRRDETGMLPTEFQFGDWCDPDAPENSPWLAKVSADFVANSFFAHSASLLAKFESIVGDSANEQKYGQLAALVAKTTWERFGAEAVKTTAGGAMALEFSICPPEERAVVAKFLAEQVRADNGKITTGFLGTPLILFALEKAGYTEEAFMMLLRREIRSWLYQVDSGATTIWERWDAIREDGSIHTGEMSTDNDHQEDSSMISFNHYAYGAVIDWVYQYVAGLGRHQEVPGYKKFIVSPRPTRSLDYASATLDSKYGNISISWELTDNCLQISLVSPFGTTAELDLPATDNSKITVNGESWDGSALGHGKHLIRITQPKVAGV